MEHIKKCQICSQVNPGLCIKEKGFDICETCVRKIQPQVKDDDNLEKDFKNAEDTSLKGQNVLFRTQFKSLLASASRSIGECLLLLNKEEDREKIKWYRQCLTLVYENFIVIESLCFKNQSEETICQNKKIKKIVKEEKKETERKSFFECKVDCYRQKLIQSIILDQELMTHRECENICIERKEGIYIKMFRCEGPFKCENINLLHEYYLSDRFAKELCSAPLYSLFGDISIYPTEKNTKQVNSFLKNLKSCKLQSLMLRFGFQENMRITPYFQDLLRTSSRISKKLRLVVFDLTTMEFAKILKTFRHLPEIMFYSCRFIMQKPIYLSNALEGCKIAKLGFIDCDLDPYCGWNFNPEKLDRLIETLSSSEHLKKSCKTIIFKGGPIGKKYFIAKLKLNGFIPKNNSK